MLGEKEVAECVDCHVMTKTLERMLRFVRRSSLSSLARKAGEVSALVGALQLHANERTSSTTLSCGEVQQRSWGRKFIREGVFLV